MPHPPTHRLTHPPPEQANHHECAAAVQQYTYSSKQMRLVRTRDGISTLPPGTNHVCTPTTHPLPANLPTTAARTAVSPYARSFWLVLESRGPGQKRGEFRFFYDRPPSRGASEPPPTKHPPPTTHPPTNPPQQYNSSAAVRTDQSTTAAQQSSSTHHSSTPGTRGAGWGFPCFCDSSPSRGKSDPSPGGPSHAPRSPSWEPSPVLSPGTPRVDA